MVDLLEPFRYEFFRNGLAVATVAGAVCGLVGVYVVLRGLSYIGHGLSHAIFGGAAASAVVGVNYFAGAGLWGLFSALAITRVSRRSRIGGDAAIGVITTASFAAGLALSNLFGSASRSIDAVLFGSILGVGRGDVVAVVAAGVLAAVVTWTCYRRLLFATFDPEVAAVSGVPVAAIEALLMLVLAVTILVSMKVLGVLLISALLVTPAVVARMLTSSFARMLWLAPVIGAACGFVGMNLSYHVDVSSGATIILVATAVFLATFAATGTSGRRRVAAVHAH